MKTQTFSLWNRSQRRFSHLAGVVLLSLALLISACSGQAVVPSQAAPIPITGATGAPTAVPTVAVPTANPTATSAANQPAPKIYIGLFKDNAVAVLDSGTNKILSTIPIPTGPHGLVITPDGKRVYASSDGATKVSVIDTSTDKVVDTIEVGKSPHGLAITPDGQDVLAAVFGANQVVMIDTHTDAVINVAPVPSPHNIAISPDGMTAYVASQPADSPSLVELSVPVLLQTAKISLTKVPRALNFSPDGKQLYFTLAGVDAVQVMDPLSNQVSTQIPVGASPHHPIFTPNGQMALVVSQGPGELSILNPMSNKVSKVVMVGMMPHWIATNPQGTTAWVTNEVSNDVTVVDLASATVTATIPVGNAPRKIVIQPQSLPRAQIPSNDPSVVTVTISAMAFSPSTISVHAGQTIVWRNQDTIAHTITSDDGKWDSGNIAPGQSYDLTLLQPGQYAYHCSIHPFMQGTLTVTS